MSINYQQKLIQSFQAIGSGIRDRLIFSGLHDTPTGYQSGYYLRSTKTGIEYIDATGVAADIGDEIVNTIVTGQLLAFTGLNDTPTGYQSGYYLRSTETGIEYIDPTGLSQDLVNNLTGVPGTFLKVDSDGTGIVFSKPITKVQTLPEPTDGDIIEYNCKLYFGCDGSWKSLDPNEVPLPEDSSVPNCISNLEEYNQYKDYEQNFIAQNINNSFLDGLNGNLEPLTYSVCLSSTDEKSSVIINETNYKWGLFSKTTTVNITATPDPDPNRNLQFQYWLGDGATLGNPNDASTTLLVDKDLSISAYFLGDNNDPTAIINAFPDEIDSQNYSHTINTSAALDLDKTPPGAVVYSRAINNCLGGICIQDNAAVMYHIIVDNYEHDIIAPVNTSNTSISDPGTFIARLRKPLKMEITLYGSLTDTSDSSSEFDVSNTVDHGVNGTTYIMYVTDFFWRTYGPTQSEDDGFLFPATPGLLEQNHQEAGQEWMDDPYGGRWIPTVGRPDLHVAAIQKMWASSTWFNRIKFKFIT